MKDPILLVVDDEPDVASHVGSVGERLGFEVSVAVTAKEAQQFWLENPVATIVIDVVMPDIDGNELIQWLVEQGSYAPIILMSGYEGKYIDSARRLGIAKGAPIMAALIKPFDPEDLEIALKKALAICQVMSRAPLPSPSGDSRELQPSFQWSESMSVGVDTLDYDHQVLLSMINRARAVVNGDDDAIPLREIATDLVAYAVHHFKREELLMKAIDYPRLKEHQLEHDVFRRKSEMLASDEAVFDHENEAVEVLNFLRDWFHNHIMRADKDFQSHMTEQHDLVREALLEMGKDAEWLE
jgi:hemerythrin